MVLKAPRHTDTAFAGGGEPYRQRWPKRASAQEELIMDSTDFNEMSWVSWMTPVDDGRRGKTSRDAAQEEPQSQQRGKVGPVKFGYPQRHAASLARRT
jgi:hypothetical protein